MLVNSQNPEEEPSARCPKMHKINRGSRQQDARKHRESKGGAVSKMLENAQNPEGGSLARCSKT